MCIRFVSTAAHLGVIIDEVLSFDSQIAHVVKLCYYNIRRLSQVKSFLNKEHLKTLVCNLILSRLDYSNSLYFGLKQSTLNLMQQVQNSAVRLVYNGTLPARSHISPYYLELHWLKVEHRIIYKILLIVYKCLMNKAPVEIIRLLQYSDSQRTMKLREARVSTMYGQRSFYYAAPKLWNLLPFHIRDAKCTIMFKS